MFIDSLVDKFVTKHSGDVQIISLGAGFDTRYYRLELFDISYYEVDFPCLMEEKKRTLLRKNITEMPKMIGMDLNEPYLNFDFNESIPTLVLVECVFPYLHATSGNELIRYFSNFQTCQLISFDMINPFDSFGSKMVLNIRELYETNLEGLLEYPSIEKIKNRFVEFQWKQCKCITMLDVWNEFIEEKSR